MTLFGIRLPWTRWRARRQAAQAAAQAVLDARRQELINGAWQQYEAARDQVRAREAAQRRDLMEQQRVFQYESHRAAIAEMAAQRGVPPAPMWPPAPAAPAWQGVQPEPDGWFRLLQDDATPQPAAEPEHIGGDWSEIAAVDTGDVAIVEEDGSGCTD